VREDLLRENCQGRLTIYRERALSREAPWGPGESGERPPPGRDVSKTRSILALPGLVCSPVTRMALVICERCRRHVKRGESVCPFCGAPRSSPGGLRRSLGAAVVLGAGLAVGGCGINSDLGNEDSGVSVDGSSGDGSTDSGVRDASIRDGQAADARSDAGDAGIDAGPVPPYGPVPLYASVPHID